MMKSSFPPFIALVSFVFYCFIFTEKSYSQSQITFRQLSVKEGLSQNSAISISQDSIGYLWIATQDGLNKYDGREFSYYPYTFIDVTKPNYSNLGKVYTDKQGNLWIIPMNKIPHKFNRLKDKFEAITTITDASIIFQDSQFNIWIGTYSNGLYLLNPKTLETTHVLKKTEINGTIFQIEQKNENEIIIAAEKQIVEYHKQTKKVSFIQPKNYSGQTVQTNFSAIAIDNSGGQWIGTYGNGLYFRDKKNQDFHRVTEYISSDKLPNDLNILALHLDKKNRLWIGTYGDGLYLVDIKKDKIEHFEFEKHDLRSLHYNDILCIYEDYSGTIWFGTDGAGISYYDEYLEKFNSYTNFQTPEGVAIDLVRAISVEKNGVTWIGTSGKGLTKYDPRNDYWHTYNFSENENSISSNRIVSLLQDADKDLWIGTQDGGLNILNSKNNFTVYNGNSKTPLNAQTVWCIFRDSENSIWLGTRDNGLIQFDKRKGEIKRYTKTNEPNALPSNNIRIIIEDDEKNLWLGTDASGIVKFDRKNQTFTSYTYNKVENTIASNNIKTLYFDENKVLWIGTNGAGLNAFDIKNQKFYNYTTKDGLANDVIYAVIPDDNNNLWLSSNKGITKFTPAQNLDQKPVIINYANYDGLATEFNTGAYFKTETGDLYYGGLEGFYFFNPNNIVENTILPKTVITKFEVFNEAFPLEDGLVLKAKQNTISFTFSSLQFSLPKKNLYEFKLNNLDENWVKSGNMNYVRYTNLPSGKYTFKVKSSNYDGVWNETPSTFKFEILQPWYFSAWAILGYIYLALTLMYLIYVYFKWRWKMQLQLKLEKSEIDRLKDLDNHKNKLYTNISHEFRTPLTLLTAPIKKQLQSQSLPDETRSDLQLIDRNASQLLHLFDQLLDLSKLESSSIKLQVREGRIDLLLKSVAASFALLAKQKKLEFASKIPSLKKAWFDSDVIEKIINNLLANAIKYTSAEGKILFKVVLTKDDKINLIFTNSIDTIQETDLSKIFDRFFQIDSSTEGSGIGLSLVKELVQLSHGTIEASYMDTKKIKFSILLPIRKDAFSTDEFGKIDLKISPEIEEDVSTSPIANISKTSIVLVVDDNTDMRKFIKSLLQNEYKVVEASNGLEGIEKALKIIPDIIVSDVMMPVKNGIELCKTLKEDEKTSHIPIILLTAKSGDDHEIIGLDTGADDYITKPFNSRKLQIKIKKLIELRQKLRQRYRQDVFLAPKDIAVTNTDEKFLKRVENILAKNLTDPTFNADNFSKLISMSRMQLHRKLTALTNLSTTAFIRSQRLKLALKMLKTSDANTSEIAYSTGFNSPSYFIKCFKEVYGKTPSEYQ